MPRIGTSTVCQIHGGIAQRTLNLVRTVRTSSYFVRVATRIWTASPIMGL